MKTQHTNTPWHIGDGKAKSIVYSENGYAVCNCITFHGKNEEILDDGSLNASRIVKCVNMHDELLKGLEMAYQELFRLAPNSTAFCHITRLLQKSKGE